MITVSFERTRGVGRVGAANLDEDRAPGAPGKRTLTEVHEAAAHGTSGPGRELPHREQIQRSFGRHALGDVVAHVGGEAEEGATAMGADAFAVGDQVAFAAQPDLHTAAHEAAHVVQQRGGVQLKGGVGAEGDPYEQHADAVADLVVQGKSSEALLDQHAGGGGGRSEAVQRHAFVGGKQIKKKDSIATGAVGAFVTDDVVRSYKTRDELKAHAAGTTDYLGNLGDGTWLRFSPTGLNVLGEMHTLVTLADVMKAVKSKSFIDERFSTDDLASGSKLKAEYEGENLDRFKDFGIEDEPDKKKFGAESLFPKIGYAMAAAIPYFTGEKSLDDLKQANDYAGKPLQRYLKLGWAHGKDLAATAAKRKRGAAAGPPKQEVLVACVTKLEASLGAFITGLSADGYLGDGLEKANNPKLVPLLCQLATALMDASFEQALTDPTARVTEDRKKELGDAPSREDKLKTLSNWRNFNFEDSVKRAAADGTRYAGMGAGHLYHLQDVGLPKTAHAYDMSGDDLIKFEDETKKLAAKAVKQ
jgi:hypothetical protein